MPCQYFELSFRIFVYEYDISQESAIMQNEPKIFLDALTKIFDFNKGNKRQINSMFTISFWELFLCAKTIVVTRFHDTLMVLLH